MARIRTLDEALFLVSEGLNEGSRAPNIKKYVPHEKQHRFHSSTKKKKLYIGGNRSGKTTGGVTEAIWRATCRHPYRPDLNAIGPNRGRVIAVDFINGVEKIIFPQYKQWLYPSALRGGSWEDAYDKTLRTLYFSNGSFIEFMSYDQDLDKFAGTSRHWIHFDEEPPKTIYVENMARLIDTDGDFWITMTPVEGMNWIYDDLYEKHVDAEDSEVEVIEIHSMENPYLTANAIKSFSDSVDEDERTARMAGKFVQVGGRIWKNFDPTIGGLHVLKEPVFEPAKEFRNCMIICALDHGFNNPAGVLWTAVDTEGYAVTFHELYLKEHTVDMMAAKIKKVNKDYGIVPDIWVADPSIRNRNAVSGTSIYTEYLKYGIAWMEGNNAVKDGLIRVRRYLNPTTKVNPENKLPIPRWRCTPNCSNLIWEAKRYRWKTYTNKKIQGENNAFEEPHKKDDHLCDTLRYTIMTRPDLVADIEENSASAKIDRIVNNLGVSRASSASMDSVADPNDATQSQHWDEFSSPSPITGTGSLGNGWEFDEHMGALY